MFRIENLFILPEEKIICEFHHLSFTFAKTLENNFQNVINETSYIPFTEYSRSYINSQKAKITWTYIVKNIWENSERFYGAINFQNKWIYSNIGKKNKKLFYKNIRVLNNKSFEDFKKQSNTIILRDLINLSLNFTHKYQEDLIDKVSRPSFFQRVNISNALINKINDYTNKSLKLLLKEFKALNAKFFNNKEINQRYLTSLSNELNTFEKYYFISTESLTNLWFDVSKIIEEEFIKNSNKDEYFLINESNFINQRIIETKHDISYGDKSYQPYKNFKKILLKNSKDKKQFKNNIFLSKKLIQSWQRGLRIDCIYLSFKSNLTFKNRQLKNFYKLAKYKTLDLLTFSKYLKKLIYLDYEKITYAISKIKNIVNQHFIQIYDDLKIAKKAISSEYDSHLHDVYSGLEIKNKKKIFYESFEINSLLLTLTLENAKRYSKKIEKNALLKYQIEKNAAYLKATRKNLDQTFSFEIFEDSKHFKHAIFLIFKNYRNLLKQMTHHYAFLQNKTKNKNNAVFAKFQIIALNNVLNHLQNLNSFIHNADWKNSLYSWALSLHLLIVKYSNHYKNKTQDFFQIQKEQIIDFTLYEKDYIDNINKWLFKNKSDTDLIKYVNFLKKYFEIKRNKKQAHYPNNENIILKNTKELNLKLNELKQNHNLVLKNISKYEHYYKYHWKFNKHERLKTRNNAIAIWNHFIKIGKNLIKKIDIINNAAIEHGLTNEPDFLKSENIYKIINSNYHILTICYKLINSLEQKHFFNKAKIIKKSLYEYYVIKYLNSILQEFEMNFLITYENYKKISNLDFLRLYLLKEFLCDPNLIIVSDLPINNLHEYNILKGLLLKQQNKQKFALTFLDEEGKLSKELGIHKLV